ncbi:hypothetical protein O6H91_19G035400 [Diphasiastrum complanatum]|uniref:Uncharacterized protein n=1 Tax=Diphasiastrum complanatum TaxID=34168 RepID=A0ACC2AVJ4_DIPCM|nr:hypothetical protein O6H91_19G035400 [Diphasiastrum complanatum]
MGSSYFTRLHREGLTSSESDSFPQLTASARQYNSHTAAEEPAIKHGSSTGMQLRHVGLETIPISYSLAVSGKIEGHNPAGNMQSAVVDELKKLYAWADNDLIQDVLASDSVNFDKNMAIMCLDSMVASFAAEDYHQVGDVTSDSVGTEKEASVLNRFSRLSVSSVHEAVLATEEAESYVVQERRRTNIDVVKIDRSLTELPTEPDWQVDDSYLVFRKDALRAARVGYQHARGAVHAFKIGDHRRARMLSKKAQDERNRAQTLNAKAASKIFNLKNSNRDIWNLDLHGLHASEAVDALQARLLEIELAKSPIQSPSKAEIVGKNYVISRVSNRLQHGSRGRALESIDPKHEHDPKKVAPKFSANKELVVITDDRFMDA